MAAKTIFAATHQQKSMENITLRRPKADYEYYSRNGLQILAPARIRSEFQNNHRSVHLVFQHTRLKKEDGCIMTWLTSEDIRQFAFALRDADSLYATCLDGTSKMPTAASKSYVAGDGQVVAGIDSENPADRVDLLFRPAEKTRLRWIEHGCIDYIPLSSEARSFALLHNLVSGHHLFISNRVKDKRPRLAMRPITPDNTLQYHV